MQLSAFDEIKKKKIEIYKVDKQHETNFKNIVIWFALIVQYIL